MIRSLALVSLLALAACDDPWMAALERLLGGPVVWCDEGDLECECYEQQDDDACTELRARKPSWRLF